MNRNQRLCSICGNPLSDTPKWLTHGYVRNGKRVPPDDDSPFKRGWVRWECHRCGTIVWVKPFADRSVAERVDF